jgi:hypothetical protein
MVQVTTVLTLTDFDDGSEASCICGGEHSVEIRLFTLAMIPDLRYCFHSPTESAPSIEDGAYEKEVRVHGSA